MKSVPISQRMNDFPNGYFRLGIAGMHCRHDKRPLFAINMISHPKSILLNYLNVSFVCLVDRLLGPGNAIGTGPRVDQGCYLPLR